MTVDASNSPVHFLRRMAKRFVPAGVRAPIGIQLQPYPTYLQLWRVYERETGHRLPLIATALDFFAWKGTQAKGRSPIGDRVPWIVYGAFRFIRSRLAPGDHVFEFGAGGSTLFLLDRGCEVVTAEHDDTWLDRVRAAIPRQARWTCHLEPPQEDVGSAGSMSAYGSSLPEYAGKSFERYVRSLASYPDGTFKAIFIDGRARSAALHEAGPKVAAGGMIVLDNAERPRYREAIEGLVRDGWQVHRFAGAGPFVSHEFWETRVFVRVPTPDGRPLAGAPRPSKPAAEERHE